MELQLFEYSSKIKSFYDFIYKNELNYDGIEKITNFAAQYKEELIENEICFNAYIVETANWKAIMVIL
jgi:hypothetical protein